jgi:hypothetical protein
LIPTAYGPDHAAVLHEGGELRTLPKEMLAYDALLAVGSSPHERHVDVAVRGGLAHMHLSDVGIYAAPL